MGLSGASSMESLNSSHSSSNTTTTSNFSKDSSTPQDSSTPPSSPHGKYYSPAGRLSSIRAHHVCVLIIEIVNVVMLNGVCISVSSECDWTNAEIVSVTSYLRKTIVAIAFAYDFFCKVVNLLCFFFIVKKRKPRLIFKQCNWFNSKLITLCCFHRFVLLVCLRFFVAGLAMNETVSCRLVNDFVRFHHCVWQHLKFCTF